MGILGLYTSRFTISDRFGGGGLIFDMGLGTITSGGEAVGEHTTQEKNKSPEWLLKNRNTDGNTKQEVSFLDHVTWSHHFPFFYGTFLVHDEVTSLGPPIHLGLRSGLFSQQHSSRCPFFPQCPQVWFRAGQAGAPCLCPAPTASTLGRSILAQPFAGLGLPRQVLCFTINTLLEALETLMKPFPLQGV